jgi:hypothetical protein
MEMPRYLIVRTFVIDDEASGREVGRRHIACDLPDVVDAVRPEALAMTSERLRSGAR